MGDGLKRASDYANSALSPFLRNVKAGGTWETTERYLIDALGGIKKAGIGRGGLYSWVEEFAARHSLIFEHDKKAERYKFIRAKF